MELAYKESLLLFIAMQSRTQVSTNTFTCFVSQSCPALCDPMDCNPPGSSVHGDSPGRNTGVGWHGVFQGIFPIQWSNPGFPHCTWILYLVSHQGSPRGTSKRPLAGTRELPKEDWPRGPTGQGRSTSSLSLFPLSGSMSPQHPPAPGLRRRGAGTPCLSELCKLPFLININIENTFIAMQIIISQRDRSHFPTYQVLKFMDINSRI